jgi:hypothetical protein
LAFFSIAGWCECATRLKVRERDAVKLRAWIAEAAVAQAALKTC